MEFIDLKSQYAAIRENVNARIQRVLDHGQYILGPEVQELEERLSQLVGVQHCVTVSSGTEALLIALMALDIKPGDEVITTPFTFAATAEMIVLLGAKPVLVDIEPDTCNIDAKLIESAITSRTRAIMPVSLYGQTADMDEINAIARRNGGIPVIEDAAQSFGATYKGRSSCGLSLIGCTSFFPSKSLGCYGDGGALFTNHDGLAEAFRQIRAHGQHGRYNHVRLGVGGRMDTLQCAVVLAKLDRFEWETANRKRLGNRYTKLIAAACGGRVELPVVRSDRDCIWAQYSLKVNQREGLRRALTALGIPTAVHYPKPIHRQPAYAMHAGASFPISERIADLVMSLPMSADLTDTQQDTVVEKLDMALNTL